MILKYMELIKRFFLLCFCVFPFITIAQVTINRLTENSAAALHLEAMQPATMEYGGFLMPIVTEAQQAAIPVSTVDNRDDGMMVFVSDPVTGKRCWDIYDATVQVWRSITCINLDCPITPTILYEENFNSYSNGTGITGASATNGDYPSGVTKWTLTSYTTARDGTPGYPGTLSNADDFALVNSGVLEIQDANGPLLFETSAIDISGYSDILISMDISENGNLEYTDSAHTDDFNCGQESIGNDYVDIEYSTDGGTTFVEVPNFSGLGTANHTLHDDLAGTVNFSVSGISGNLLVIRVRIQNWAAAEQYFLDNILVTCN
jgi:hypothetical protein